MKEDYIRVRISTEDKEKLKKLADDDTRNMSDWIINQIRTEYKKQNKK